MGEPTFRCVQGLYGLCLGVWLGSLVMVGIAAGVTFRTVKSYEPMIGAAPYAQLREDGAPGQPERYALPVRILAGGIVGNVLRALAVVQLCCAVVVGICVVIQCTLFRRYLAGGVRAPANLGRLVLLAVPMLILGVDQAIVSPEMWRMRGMMYDAQRPLASRVEVRAAFDRWHRVDEQMVGAAAVALAGAVVCSAFAWHANAPTPGAGARGRGSENRSLVDG